jgi:hypothetical protein
MPRKREKGSIMAKHALMLIVLAVFSYGCGDSDSESSFTECFVRESDCSGGTCRDVEACEVDECETDADYFFGETEYESKCTFGETLTTIEYPLGGGPGRQTVRRDVDECFYETEIEADGDIEEEGRCTRVRDCTVETLDCDVIDSEPCVEAAAAPVS